MSVELPSPKMLAYRYRRGATYRQLAAEFGVNESIIRRRVRGLVEGRRTGPPRAPIADEEILRLRGEGMSWRGVAAQVGMSQAGARKRYRIATEGAEPWR